MSGWKGIQKAGCLGVQLSACFSRNLEKGRKTARRFIKKLQNTQDQLVGFVEIKLSGLMESWKDGCLAIIIV